MKHETRSRPWFAGVGMALSMLVLIDERTAEVAQVNACHDKWYVWTALGRMFAADMRQFALDCERCTAGLDEG
ncbi:hypothetical protein J1614_010883 [Plenodomus biglobosus]|nr:hypothetical protein J1614_010883 [Plenodomus biglobosus]